MKIDACSYIPERSIFLFFGANKPSFFLQTHHIFVRNDTKRFFVELKRLGFSFRTGFRLEKSELYQFFLHFTHRCEQLARNKELLLRKIF